MLDIKYFKQIDEVLEVEEFTLHENLDGGYFLEVNNDDESRYVIGSDCDIHLYNHYLSRVIEAINKKDLKIGLQSIDIETTKEGVFVNHSEPITIGEQEGVSEGFTPFALDTHKTMDLCREKAITYVMDHIKEKV